MKITLNDKQLSVFDKVMSTLKEDTYLVGGFVRDFLLGRNSDDMDFATAMDPVDVHCLFEDALYFPRYGTTSFRKDFIHVTIASLRKEEDYSDFRHPQKVSFIKDYKIDALRRDFTINAFYVDKNFEILDPTGNGLKDLQNKTLRVIGDPVIRFKEDPLRILRAYRFSYELNFSFDKSLEKVIEETKSLLCYLNIEKVKEELRKCPNEAINEIVEVLNLNI